MLPWVSLASDDNFHSTIHAAFEQAANALPDNIALRTGGEAYTFGVLNQRANRIAATLREHAQSSRPVGILLPKGAHWVAAWLGAMKAGAPAAFLEPDRPIEQTRIQVTDLEPGYLITSQALCQTAGPLGIPLLIADAQSSAGLDVPDPGIEISPDSIAAIFYTSGSSGLSRGVMQPHRSLFHNAVVQILRYQLTPNDRILLLTFHAGALLASLLSGACCSFLTAADGGLEGLPARIREEEITHILATASTFRGLAAISGDEGFPLVGMVQLSSETIFRSDFNLFRGLCPNGKSFVVNYGSTEALGVSDFVVTGQECFQGDIVPIGRPYRGKEILILDSEGHPLPPGQQGEIAVRSRFIGAGYWRRPEDTRTRFLEDPADPSLRTFLTRDAGQVVDGEGTVLLHGRLDSLVKVRGSLVPLQDVEAALLAVPGIAEVVVSGPRSGESRSGLTAYLLAAPGGIRPAWEIRAALASLPEALVPSTFLWVDRWPLLPSGKIDKAALPNPPRSRASYIAGHPVTPRTPEEHTIAGIWAETLQLDEVGVDDEFLSLGGDSLTATVIAVRLSAHFQTSLSLAQVFEGSTVAALAGVISRRSADEHLERLLAEVESLSAEEVKRQLAELA